MPEALSNIEFMSGNTWGWNISIWFTWRDIKIGIVISVIPEHQKVDQEGNLIATRCWIGHQRKLMTTITSKQKVNPAEFRMCICVTTWVGSYIIAYLRGKSQSFSCSCEKKTNIWRKSPKQHTFMPTLTDEVQTWINNNFPYENFVFISY